MNIKHVVELKNMLYDGNEEKFKELIEELADGKDPIGNHIREGCVIRLNSSKWKAWKHKNFSFKMLEGLIKDDETVVDIEEQEDIKEEEK
jgi:hypothetical protein